MTVLHLVHTITRLAEQNGVTAIIVRKIFSHVAKRYLNHLSDYLFVLRWS